MKGGVYKNSCASNIRLKADYSYIHDATVIVDEKQDGQNQRGIRLDNGNHLWVYNTEIHLSDPNGHAIVVYDDVEKARIQDCNIYVGEGTSNYGIIIREETGAVDIFDTDIQFEGTGNPLIIKGHNDSSDERVYVLRTTISGSGDGSNGRNAIRCTRSTVEFKDVEVRMDGDHYRRALELHGDNCLVDGGVFESTHHAIVNVADGTIIRDVTARSYNGRQALKLYDGYSDVTVQDSVIYGGYLDKGTANLKIENVGLLDW